MPGLIFHYQVIANINFATTLGYSKINLIIQVFAATLHLILVNVTLYLGFGYNGVCIVTSTHFFWRWLATHFIINTEESLKNPYPDEVKLFSNETISNLQDQTKLCLYGLFMGWWSVAGFDCFTLIASYLSFSTISAQTIMRTLGLLTFMIPLGQ